MSEEDRKAITKSSTNRRIIYLDRAPFSTSKDQGHDPERGFGQHCAAADIRPHACCSHWTMSGMYEIGSEEHLEGQCPG